MWDELASDVLIMLVSLLVATLAEVLGGGEEWIEVAAVGGGGADWDVVATAASGVDVGAWVGPGDEGT